jgi:hypothetical protein
MSRHCGNPEPKYGMKKEVKMTKYASEPVMPALPALSAVEGSAVEGIFNIH